MPINPDRIRYRLLKAAEGYLELAMPDQALGELNQITDFGEQAYVVYIFRGQAYRDKRDHAPALKNFREAHLLRPTELSPLMNMAWCYKRLDQLPQAIDAMKLAYKSHKETPQVLYNLACYFALAGEKDNALSWLGRSLRLDRTLLADIPTETDFDSLRNDSDFLHLLELSSEGK
jgi:tetratricopeptide (TPR) repeat protein